MKSEITDIQKTPKYSIYAFTKGNDFFKKIQKFLMNLGFIDIDGNLGYYINDKLIIPNPEKIVDERRLLVNDDYTVHFIFGNRKIFMIIHYKIDKEKEVSDKIFRYFSLTKQKCKRKL